MFQPDKQKQHYTEPGLNKAYSPTVTRVLTVSGSVPFSESSLFLRL